jgi:hypothetical protein
MSSTLDAIFARRTEGISSIFSSYKTLYGIYVGGLKSLKANQNTITAIENAKSSVEAQQEKISNQLHAQGFILLTGAAEVLLKDTFICLLQENFTKFTAPSSMNFAAKEIQQIINSTSDVDDVLESISAEFGSLAVKKLYSAKNPIEKINFQNVEATKQLLETYFGLKLIDSDYLKNIHRHWQARHVLVHNNSIVDERFVHNVKAVDLLQRGEEIGESLKITKKIYDDVNEDFLKLFNELDQLIVSTDLKCSMVHVSSDPKSE